MIAGTHRFKRMNPNGKPFLRGIWIPYHIQRAQNNGHVIKATIPHRVTTGTKSKPTKKPTDKKHNKNLSVFFTPLQTVSFEIFISLLLF
ncbi:MAG: hypothetical protein IJV70_07465 [Clostridia bacterium]|nr:hypothetical protein [Clostridia bacterium]